VEPDGERSMLTDRGANLELRAATVATAVGGVTPGGHVHVSGYCLLDAATQAAGLAAIDAARSVGATWSLDASSAGPLRALGPERFLSWAEGASFLLCNLEEGSLLTGQSDPESVARALTDVAKEAAVTLGSLGAIAATPSGLHALPAVVSTPTDTTGAGDAFGGTYLARRLAGDSIEAAGAAATDVASRVVAQHGARGWSVGYSRE
jgi:sugar/nucleoside kinase (ribokinase family)